jgi:hypothetical protein
VNRSMMNTKKMDFAAAAQNTSLLLGPRF